MSVEAPSNWDTLSAEDKRAWFITQAGGQYTSKQDYDNVDKKRRFWSFFTEMNLTQRMLDVYATSDADGGTVEELIRDNLKSIEHIVPKVVLRDLLAENHADNTVIYGARTNPFNFAPSHRNVNSMRSNWKFDLEGEAIVQRGTFGSYLYEFVGLDHEQEWVIPVRTRGDLSRAMLYMVLVYGIRYLTEQEIARCIEWSAADAVAEEETLYNTWIHNHPDYHNIHNPLITHPSTAALPGLFESVYLGGPETPARLPAKPAPPTVAEAAPLTQPDAPVEEIKPLLAASVKIVGLLSNPVGADSARTENVCVLNYGRVPIHIDAQWTLRVLPIAAGGSEQEYPFAEVATLQPNRRKKLTFNSADVLPNKGAVVTLLYKGTPIASVTYAKDGQHQRTSGHHRD